MELKRVGGVLEARGDDGLLIEPYGIETAVRDLSELIFLAFNRTLWN